MYDLVVNKKTLWTVIYSMVFAIGMSYFIIPSGIFSTGMTGIVQIFTEIVPGTNFGFIYLLINIPGLILAYFKIGKQFTFYTLISVFTVTLVTDFLPSYELTSEPILNSLFGGVICGAGIGGLLKIGSSSGGLDIFGVWYFKKTGVDFKNFNLAVNCVIILVGAFVYGTDIAMLTLFSTYFKNLGIAQIFTSNEKLTVWIIGNDLSLVTLYIQNKLKHGTTHFDAKGGFSNDNKEVLMTILNKYEYAQLVNEIYDIEKNIFINVTETYKIDGNYKEKRV